MEAFEQHVNIAKKEIGVADHLLHVTYDLVKDSKFLLAVMQHVIKAADNALDALLEYERYYKNIDMYSKIFNVKIDLFKSKLALKHKFDDKYYRLLLKLHEINKYDKESVMKFKRSDKYILALGNYDTKSLDVEGVKRFSNMTKDFVEKATTICVKKKVFGTGGPIVNV